MVLLQKLLKIQAELKAPKNQYNKFGEFYYRSCEDILSAAKPLCIREGILLYVTDEVKMIGERYYVKATASVTDGENTLFAEAYARETESRPKMDAAQLTGAASSYARKYALNGLFCLDDTKDADAMKFEEPQKAKTKAKTPTKDDYLREVAAEAKKQHLGGKEVQYILRTRYQKSSSSELTLEEASDLAANFIQYAVTYINEMGMNEDDNKLMEGV